MAKSAFQVVAEFDRNIGSPGLVHTMQVMRDQFMDLSMDEQDAYEDFRVEIENLADDLIKRKVVI